MFKKIIIATFSLTDKGKRTPINGMIEPLLSYFLDKTEKLDLIDGFHPGSSDVITKAETYTNGKQKKSYIMTTSKLLKPILLLSNKNKTQTIFKIRDILTTLEWGIRTKGKYDLFIGLESIYTLTGIFLKKIGKVKKVVYYVSDFSPNRYGSSLFNSIYLALDRFCAMHADYVWDVSPAMHPARIKEGLDPKKASTLILIPNALFPKQINPAPKNRIMPHSLVFAGTLGLSNGPDIAVAAMPKIIKKYKNATLHIFGSNSTDQKRIMDLIKELQLDKSVIFHGFVKDAIDLTRDIHLYSIGVAPYLNMYGSYRKYGDATKLRLYMGAGLPIITTDVPPLGKEVEKLGAAIITDDTPEAIAKCAIELFNNPKRHQEMREKAIRYAKNNTWENAYSSALQRMN